MDNQSLSDFAKLGIQFETDPEIAKEVVFEVWAQNVKSVELFGLLSTQWRTASGPWGIKETGLDYTAVRATALTIFGRKKLKKLLLDIVDMETAALNFFHEVAP